jgi:hypothetical protein
MPMIVRVVVVVTVAMMVVVSVTVQVVMAVVVFFIYGSRFAKNAINNNLGHSSFSIPPI